MEYVIRVDNLHSKVHEGVDWKLKKNDLNCIIGPSGEGKSTFLRILLGLEKYKEGIIFDSHNELWDVKNHKIGVQFQNGGLLNSMTIGENIMLPLLFHKNMNDVYAKYIALEYMEHVELNKEVFFKYPSECSGGMQKRAALARAMILEPEILFLDEPTAGLDHLTCNNYCKLLKSFKDITIIMVTHDIHQVKTLSDIVTVFIDKKAYSDKLENLINYDNMKLREFLKDYV